MRYLTLIFMVSSTILASCRTAADQQQYAGMYMHSFEVESFEPCGSAERWWVANPSAIQEHRSASAASGMPVYLFVRGNISGRGQYGHLGNYQRMLTITEVIAIEPDRRC